ncbi:hypothetical protein QUF70_00855 [Desulfobacterales bacterium HSG17]|nr:hypothetical protein [Desulfobacterales bacterium HSG17]
MYNLMYKNSEQIPGKAGEDAINLNFQLKGVNEEHKDFIPLKHEHDAELIVARRSLDSITKSAPGIIYKLDSKGMITFINDAVARC